MAESYEFIDCPTISIAYQANGLATVSFTVVSTEQIPGVNPPRNYTELTFGAVDFNGYLSEVQSSVIPASIPTVFEHKMTVIAVGCADNCPRGIAIPS
jgi:hypothetical protein